MPMQIIVSDKLDANETAYFQRELETVKAKTYDVVYPEYKVTRIIPVSLDAGSGADTIVYEQYDMVGFMKIISNYAQDLPSVEVKGQEFRSPVRSLGGSYRYSVQDIRTAAKAGKPLNARKATAIAQAYQAAINNIGFKARQNDPEYAGLVGLFYAPNVTTATVAAGAGGSRLWANKTSDEICADINNAITLMMKNTKGVEVPDSILLPLSLFRIISTKRMTSDDSMTVLEQLQKNNPMITRWEWLNELEDLSPLPSTPDDASSHGNCIIIYRYSPDKLTLEIPQPLEQFPAEARGLSFVVAAHARCGGVIVYYPLSIYILEGM